MVGTHTYGKGVFQEIVSRSPAAARSTSLSGEYFTPNGHNLGAPGVAHGRTLARGPGITPDVYAYTKPTARVDTALLTAERVAPHRSGEQAARRGGSQPGGFSPRTCPR